MLNLLVCIRRRTSYHIHFLSCASSLRSPILSFLHIALILLYLYMDSSRGQNGIQQLLAAEQEAQQIVNAARNAKLARLKQAKEEAEKEVAEFRAQMEAEYQRKLTETSGDSGANVKRLEKETDAKIQHLKTEAERISGDVVGMLLKHVTTVRY
ncbi:putative vacuolar (H+)-ATPase G subunit [Helianthus annuus]|nr:putative vacuolar (H+)-ATPase G subunit [Helianthus annuus]